MTFSADSKPAGRRPVWARLPAHVPDRLRDRGRGPPARHQRVGRIAKIHKLASLPPPLRGSERGGGSRNESPSPLAGEGWGGGSRNRTRGAQCPVRSPPPNPPPPGGRATGPLQ